MTPPETLSVVCACVGQEEMQPDVSDANEQLLLDPYLSILW